MTEKQPFLHQFRAISSIKNETEILIKILNVDQNPFLIKKSMAEGFWFDFWVDTFLYCL